MNCLSELIFSKKNYTKQNIFYNEFCIFGIKFRLKDLKTTTKYQSKIIESYKLFADNLINLLRTPAIAEKKILIVEPNRFHGEVIPGYIKYFSELGFNTDVIVLPEVMEYNPFCRLNLKNVNIYTLDRNLINVFLSSPKVNEYDIILFTTFDTYSKNSPTIFDTFPNIKEYIEKLIVVEHRTESADINLKNNKQIIILANLNPESGYIFANPHYFGDVNITSKNKNITEFITVGTMKSFRKNSNLLIDAVKKLDKSGIDNFKINIIGKETLKNIPIKIRKYFNILGKVDFETMYKAMEQSDFFLPLLDTEIPEHERYIKTGTSGSFQLIYGFKKPCLLAEKFAKIHYFNSENSILYKHNEDLADSMKAAINMTDESYLNMQQNLKNTADEIYKISLENLSKII